MSFISMTAARQLFLRAPQVKVRIFADGSGCREAGEKQGLVLAVARWAEEGMIRDQGIDLRAGGRYRRFCRGGLAAVRGP